MALQVNGYASQAQLATVSPFQQRGNDNAAKTEFKDTSADRSQTRAAGTSASEPQKSNLVQTSARESDDSTTSSKSTQQRGSLVDVTV